MASTSYLTLIIPLQATLNQKYLRPTGITCSQSVTCSTEISLHNTSVSIQYNGMDRLRRPDSTFLDVIQTFRRFRQQQLLNPQRSRVHLKLVRNQQPHQLVEMSPIPPRDIPSQFLEPHSYLRHVCKTF